MSFRDTVKRNLPAYRTAGRLQEQIAQLRRDIKETNKKNEYLFWLSQMKEGETLQDTKERVYLAMPKATGRLRDIQLAEDYILKRVKRICDENGLQFFLIGGTLLGAVRHKGFIPWDNDVDIGMMKADFLKLRELLDKDSELTLQYYYKYETGLKIPKVEFRTNDVFFVDVFVFDYADAAPESKDRVWTDSQKMNLEYSRRLRELSAPYPLNSVRAQANAELDKASEKLEAELFGSCDYVGHGDYIFSALDMPYWNRDPRGIVPADDFLPLRKDAVEFEGTKYDAWNRYEKALTHMFGDYWTLPFSVSEPHTDQFDEGFDEALAAIKKLGIIG